MSNKWRDCIHERRIKLMHIPVEHILKVIVPPNSDHVYSLWSKELPDDCLILNVSHNHEINSFMVKVAHPDFAPVPIGGYPPLIDHELFCFSLTKKLPETGDAEEIAARMKKNLDDWGYNDQKADS